MTLEYQCETIGHSLGRTVLGLEWRQPWLELGQIQTQIGI